MSTPITAPPPLFTAAEVARWLRLLDEGASPDEVAGAVRVVHRLVRQGRLHPIRAGKSYIFSAGELERFAREESAPTRGDDEAADGENLRDAPAGHGETNVRRTLVGNRRLSRMG